MKTSQVAAFLRTFWLTVSLATPAWAADSEDDLPSHLRDRGTGIATSMFGTYIRAGELLFYPFFEYYHDSNMEYKPAELGYVLDEDFEGKYRAYEGLLFLGYGLSERLAIEIEASVIDATLTRDPDDPSSMPEEIHESGVGDVEGQLRFRWFQENESRPELFSYFEVVAPVQRTKLLIGTPDWEFKLGTGVTRGFGWGTTTARIAVAYSMEESKMEAGEYALEYLKRLSSFWRIYAGVEGSEDEIELITEAQLHFSRSMFLKVNNAFGLTPKATDWAPEVGIMFAFPVGRKED